MGAAVSRRSRLRGRAESSRGSRRKRRLPQKRKKRKYLSPAGCGHAAFVCGQRDCPYIKVFLGGKVYSSEKVFTASSPDTAGGPPCGRPLLHASVFARRSLFRVLFILRAVRPSLRKGARRKGGLCAGRLFLCRKAHGAFAGEKGPFLRAEGRFCGKAAHTVDIFFPAG